ncbi:MAG TPA: hypothetical protein VK642_15010 [Burkholderiales bacterium]|nr:hypothetical protein [Burkholderiales bacterium]
MFALIARNLRALHGRLAVLVRCGLMAVLVSSIAITAMAATPVGTTITNTAQVQWTVGGSTVTASAQQQITVSPYTVGSDLALTMTGPAQVAPGSIVV